MPQLSENTGHWGKSQIRQGYKSRFRILLQVWYLYIFCIIYIVVSFQKQQHSTSKMHQTRYLLPGCRGSHRLPQPHQGGLVALPMGGAQDPTTLAQPPAELAGQQHLTTGWATSLILSQLPTGNPCWQSCQPLCPQLLLSTKGDGQAPFLMVGWNGLLGSGQDGGKPGTSELWPLSEDWYSVTPTFGPNTRSIQSCLSWDSGCNSSELI